MTIEKLIGKSITLSGAPGAGDLKLEQSGDENALPRVQILAYTGAAIRQPGVKLPIVVDIAGLEVPRQEIPIRLSHKSTENGVGHTTTITKEPERIIAEGLISRDTPGARDVLASARNGYPWQASIGAKIKAYRTIKAGESVRVNGRDFEGPLHVVTRSELYEISATDLGQDSDTTLRVAASMENETDEGGHTMDKDSGQDAGSSTEKKVEASKKDTESGVLGSIGVGEELKAEAQRAELEAKRQTGISASAKAVMKSRPEIGSHVLACAERAIEAGMPASEFELEMLRLQRDIPGVGKARNDGRMSGEVVEAALCISGGMDTEALEASFDERTLNAADRRFSSGIGLHEAVMLAAQERGFSELTIKADLPGALRCAFGAGSTLEASFSTVDLPNVLSNVANKFLGAGFKSVDNSWTQIAKTRSVRDFKQTTTIAFGGDFIMKSLPASGEIEHGKPGETVYNNQASTVARMVSITREHLINDDLGALTQIPEYLGRGSALKLNTDFWTEFLDHASFFAAGNNNLKTGAGSALGIAGLTASNTAFMDQTDPDGNTLGIRPSILLVPVELGPTAKQLMSSLEVRNPAASAAFGTANPFAGTRRVVESPYLTSATAWFDLADPRVLATMEVVFLNGRRMPTVETAEANFNTLGIQMRGFFDYGVSKHEFRAGVKNAGA